MKSKKRLGNSANFVSFRDLATPSFLGNRERWNEQIPIVISKLKMDEERRIFSGSLCKKFGSDRLVPFFLIFISCFFSVVCFGSCLSSRDGIRVYDGPDVRSPVMAHLCDSSNHVPFWSSSSQLLVEFFSDSAGQRTFEGFEAKFHFVSTAGASASSSASSSTAGQGWPLISLASSFCYHIIAESWAFSLAKTGHRAACGTVNPRSRSTSRSARAKQNKLPALNIETELGANEPSKGRQSSRSTSKVQGHVRVKNRILGHVHGGVSVQGQSRSQG